MNYPNEVRKKSVSESEPALQKIFFRDEKFFHVMHVDFRREVDVEGNSGKNDNRADDFFINSSRPKKISAN